VSGRRSRPQPERDVSLVERTEKAVTLKAAAELVADGDTVALGGYWYHNQPAAFARELVRAGKRDLVASGSPVGGYAQDLLLGTGVATRTILPHLSFDDFGLSPNLRYMVEGGRAVVEDCDEAALVGGFRAAAQRLDALPVAALRRSWIVDHSPLVVRADGRLSEREALAFRPDVSVVHVAFADVYGNGVHLRSPFADRVLARAGRRVVLTAERLVSNDQIRAAPHRTTIPALYVDAVVEVPGGALPGSCHGLYVSDEQALEAYLRAADARRRGDPTEWESTVGAIMRGAF
jgi:glutaconate CoA-transferase subunit A